MGINCAKKKNKRQLWSAGTYQRHGVDGADNDGGEPERDDGTAAVEEEGGLVLNRLPLSHTQEKRTGDDRHIVH